MKLIFFNRCVQKRYAIVFLTFWATILMYILRTNLSIAIVDMSSDKNITIGNKTYFEKAEFHWSPAEKGFILSLFSYGFLFAPVGSLLAVKYGGGTVCGLGIFLTGFLTLLSPILFRFHLVAYAVARILEGLFEGCITSGYVELFVHWIPEEERSRSLTYAHIGSFFGAALNYPFSGYVANLWGWPAVFYVTGGLSCFWYIIWFTFVSNEPQTDKFISESEKCYLKEKIKNFSREQITYPWKKIFTSKPVWALLNDNFVMAWSYSFIVYCLPVYIKDVYDTNIENIGLISSIPILFSVMSETTAAILSDYLRTKAVLSNSNVHKSFIIFGQISAVILLIITANWTNFIGSIVCFSLIRLCYCFAEMSYEVLPIDMAGIYGSLIYALTVSTFSIGCLLNPTLMGYLVTNHTRTEWNHYFIVLSIFNIWGFIIYWRYGSGEFQPWAEQSAVDNENKPVEQFQKTDCF
ncbi:hypothetical protein PGB90_002321 [Kerria lacca]